MVERAGIRILPRFIKFILYLRRKRTIPHKITIEHKKADCIIREGLIQIVLMLIESVFDDNIFLCLGWRHDWRLRLLTFVDSMADGAFRTAFMC